MIKIILPYVHNFKKAARYLPDQMLDQQIADIDLFAAHLYDGDVNPLQIPLFKHYRPQAKWLFKYQIELIKEWEYRHRTTHEKHYVYKSMYRRLKNPFFPLHKLYGTQKWDPIYITRNGGLTYGAVIEKYSRRDIQHFPNKVYTRRKAPKGVNG